MEMPFELWLFAVAVVLQGIGVVAAVVARLSVRPEARAVAYPLFYLSLLSVGAITLLAVACGHGIWISCGVTLALMAVGATLDVGRRQPASAF